VTKIVPAPTKNMKIELADTKEDAYANFVDSIRNPGTKLRYVRYLEKFLNLIPSVKSF